MNGLSVLALSYAVRVLEPGSREQRRMEELSGTLDRHVMIVFTRRNDGLLREYHAGNLSVYGTHARTKLGILLTAFWLSRQVLREHRKEHFVISSQDPFEASLIGWPLALLYGLPHHVQLHRDAYGNSAWRLASRLNRLRAWWGKIVLRKASAVRVVSKRIKQALVAMGIEPQKICVLPVLVELEPFLQVGRARYELARPVPDPVRCLYVGRFSPEKNLALLVRAFAGAVQALPQGTLHLQLVGAGPEQPAVEKLIEELRISSNITITHWNDNVPQLMADSDILLLSSDNEGYGLVILEAMAAGLPVVTTAVGLVGETLQSNVHGVVVPIKDMASFAAGIQRLAIDPILREKYGRAGVLTAAELVVDGQTYKKRWRDSFLCSTN